MFPTMMSKQPTRVRIEHPKFWIAQCMA
jgi:hypothetical protein